MLHATQRPLPQFVLSEVCNANDSGTVFFNPDPLVILRIIQFCGEIHCGVK